MRHALNTMFCLLLVSCLVGELFCLHTTVMLVVCYINRQPGRGYHYSESNACGESAASKKKLTLKAPTTYLLTLLTRVSMEANDMDL